MQKGNTTQNMEKAKKRTSERCSS